MSEGSDRKMNCLRNGWVQDAIGLAIIVLCFWLVYVASSAARCDALSQRPEYSVEWSVSGGCKVKVIYMTQRWDTVG